MPRLDGILDQVISPAPLLAGVVVGLAACSLAGYEAGSVNRFRDFRRFQEATDYRSNYRPSASQVRSILRDKVRPDQVAVIVAGNSVMMGMGQGTDGVWTQALQAELGDRYRVVNLALPGVGLQEFGALAAEMLYKDGHQRVILITNTWLYPTSPIGEPDGRQIVWWFYWDAHERGLLLDSPERDARLALPLNKRIDGAKDQRARDELLKQAAIDRWLNYRDLWNAFEYEAGVTVWCKPLAKSWSRPRKRYPDADPVVPPASPELLERVKPQLFPHLPEVLRGLRPVVRRPSGEPRPAAELGGPYPPEETLRAAFPPPMRERTIVVANRIHPYFLTLLTPDERITYDALAPAMAAIFGRTGVGLFEAGRGYGASDYYDHVHLTRAGGRRLAGDLAPVIRRRAAALGFVEETRP
jgi:hypothetical protein